MYLKQLCIPLYRLDRAILNTSPPHLDFDFRRRQDIIVHFPHSSDLNGRAWTGVIQRVVG